MNTPRTIAAAVAALALIASCRSRDSDSKQASAVAPSVASAPAMEAVPEQEELARTGGLDDGIADRRAANEPGMPGKDKAAAFGDEVGGGGEGKKKGQAGPVGGERGAAARAWFPETFLFEPLIVTDDQGVADVSVRVPDRLTTWRVLGLAHSRGGAQAGAVATFAGTLPVYVDPVLPPLVRVGDQARVPIQLVNTTAEPVDVTLSLEIDGATLAGGGGPARIPPRQSVVRYATLGVTRPGAIRLLARLGEADAVLRTTQALPLGRPVTHVARGSLAKARTVTVERPLAADPGAGKARLVVTPGALAIVRAELAAGARGGGLAEDAFALHLAGTAPAVLRALGDEPDPDAVRAFAIVAAQRAVRHGRMLSIDSATLLASAALAHPDSPVLTRLGRRAVEHIAQNQAPDGTCGGDSGWTLQRLLVVTAACARAAASERLVHIRAVGAFERHAAQITDAYTAAAVLASGAVTDSKAERLRELVRAALYQREDGSWAMKVPAGAVRADGSIPSEVEATAMAVLALDGDAKAPLADLGATVLAGYVQGAGWGDGRADLVCLEAALRALRGGLPATIAITLRANGAVVASGVIKTERRHEPVVLEAATPVKAGAHAWIIEAEPPVPGLGFTLSVTEYVPWTREAPSGLELDVAVPAAMAVGAPADVRVRAAAPAGMPLHMVLPLPAGVQVDRPRLEALVEGGAVQRYQVSDAGIELHAAALEPAALFEASIRVVPTLAGALHSGAASLDVDQAGTDVTAHVPPARWTVR